MVKNQCAMHETWVQSLIWEAPLEKGMSTHSSILVWNIPWAEDLVAYNPWGHKESDTTVAKQNFVKNIIVLKSVILND